MDRSSILNRWTVLVLLALAVTAWVIVPAWVIQPFRAQKWSAFEISYVLRRWAPLATLFGALAAIAIAVALWPDARPWWRKVLLVMLLVPATAAAWFARQNYFEWSFNPLPNPEFVAADRASFVADRDMVIAVAISGEAVAYPIRQLAYHHLVHDEVGGVPIVATY